MFLLGGVSWSGEVTSSEDASDFVPAVSFLETGVGLAAGSSA